MLIARLIAEKAKLETRLERAIQMLTARDMPVAVARMLRHEGKVLQLSLPHGDAATLRHIIEEVFAPSAALICDREPVLPQLFVSDMDSTIIGQECIDELADFAGLKDQVSAITERAMRGELPFAEALRERVGLLVDLEESAIAHCLEERISLNRGARELIATLKANGCRTVLVTGGFHDFADPVGAMAGFDRVVGNRLAVRDGKLTGELDGPLVDSGAKRQTLEAELGVLGANALSLAAGDGANDIPMLQAADYGIACNAKPAAREAANGWIGMDGLAEGDLTTILELLDVPRKLWVT